ncbi:tail fiber protein [uncultured Mediterranean phage uvDeep-CGR2-KM21-C368]|nr:tail fiber protein [uncultured Mediterranean phage uvDeep-CGR2-KM21-C368]
MAQAHIQINDSAPRVQYTGSTSLGPYNVTFEWFADADLKVYIGDTLKTLTTHYTLVGAGTNGTRQLTFTTGNGPADSADVITILRDVAVARTSDFATAGAFQIDTLNTELDKITAQVAQQEFTLRRIPTLKNTTADANLDKALPEPAAYKGIRWNSGATALEAVALNFSATTSTLTVGSPATVTYNASTGAFAFGLPTGATGATGPTGTAATVAVGSVTGNTVSVGGPATAAVANSGSSAAATLDFTFGIPVGATGAAGPPGPQGPAGTGNMDDYILTADSGSNQTVEDGETVDIEGGTAINTVVGATNKVTVNADVGTSASKLVQLDGSARLPAVDGSQLTNLPGASAGFAIAMAVAL